MIETRIARHFGDILEGTVQQQFCLLLTENLQAKVLNTKSKFNLKKNERAQHYKKNSSYLIPRGTHSDSSTGSHTHAKILLPSSMSSLLDQQWLGPPKFHNLTSSFTTQYTHRVTNSLIPVQIKPPALAQMVQQRTTLIDDRRAGLRLKY